jgi:protein-S-isoprenylcysteine O-methyltransferase Ste14
MLLNKIVYAAALLAEIWIRTPYARALKTAQREEKRISATEKFLLFLLSLGMFLLPMLYIFTPWLSFADYHLPAWCTWIGIPVMVAAVVVFRQSHLDLKTNWSPSLEIFSSHSLVTGGIYARIRHPMYLSQWIWVIGQALLLQNWLAGPLDLLLFIPFYLIRVRTEERMMLDRFGDQYREYMQRTSRIGL